MRIIALGVLHRPKTRFTVNPNALAFLNPPDIRVDNGDIDANSDEQFSAESRSNRSADLFMNRATSRCEPSSRPPGQSLLGLLDLNMQ